MAFDNMGRMIGTSTQYSFLPGITYSNAYGYDAASNRTAFTAPDGSTNTYAYDTLGRLTTPTNSLTGQFGFGYDNLGRRTALNRPNGVNTTYGYDSLSRLLNVLHKAGTVTLDGAGYTYDNAGNRTVKTNYGSSSPSEVEKVRLHKRHAPASARLAYVRPRSQESNDRTPESDIVGGAPGDEGLEKGRRPMG
jgi:YD repeat-containing protein